ncbi:hypothetical protein EHS25_008743 [Saitozyma podzolica]|uniref:Mediator of RNA polymerase II transcription subunit 11 n=1 Tax=Saitozyma podzolica TaxID=1890683 RepID=A0A427YMH0_9TREE|nr:hypothetical protein EHS25_008743 [Saitozyma podzolica]
MSVEPDTGSAVDPTDAADPLDLESLDADSLFAALTAVERAVPDLLLHVKPVLSHLSGPGTSLDAASDAIQQYMDLLDKIQFVLRQTVYYLRETRASTSALRPPPPNAIPTPFASSLPPGALLSESQPQPQPHPQPQPPAPAPTQDRVQEGATAERSHTHPRPADGDEEGGYGDGDGAGRVELGLYGSRLEARSLEELANVLRRLRDHEESRRAADGQHGLEREEGGGDREVREGEGEDEEDQDEDGDEDVDVDVDEEVDVDLH